jgi:IS5 family transposase
MATLLKVLNNLADIKSAGVLHFASELRGLRIKDMVKSNRVYRKLHNFRAGIESDISCLKRADGLARCIWRGFGHFKAYVWSSVVAHDLPVFARPKPT